MEEISSFVKRYSILQYYFAFDEASKETVFMVWTENIIYEKKPTDFPDLVQNVLVVWKHVLFFQELDNHQNIEEEVYAPSEFELLKNMDIATKKKLFCAFQHPNCLSFFDYQNVVSVSPSIRRGIPVIQVGVIGKGYIPFAIDNNGEIITNKLCQIPTTIDLEIFGIYEVDICNFWTENYAKIGRDICSKETLSKFGTIGGVLKSKNKNDNRKFITTCDHVINENNVVQQNLLNDDIISCSPAFMKFQFLSQLGLASRILRINSTQPNPNYNELINDAVMMCDDHEEIFEAIRRIDKNFVSPTNVKSMNDVNAEVIINWFEKYAVSVGTINEVDQIEKDYQIKLHDIINDHFLLDLNIIISTDISVIEINHNEMETNINAIKYFGGDNENITKGIKKPTIFASMQSIYSYLLMEAGSGNHLEVLQSGATCCPPNLYRTGQIFKPMHSRVFLFSNKKQIEKRILYNQMVVKAIDNNVSNFGYKGDSGAWVYGLNFNTNNNNTTKNNDVVVVGVLTGGGASSNGLFTYICIAEKLNEKYFI
jgi:hypothetical protein